MGFGFFVGFGGGRRSAICFVVCFVVVCFVIVVVLFQLQLSSRNVIGLCGSKEIGLGLERESGEERMGV